VFWLEIAYLDTFWGFGSYFPKWCHPLFWPAKGLSLHGNNSFEPRRWTFRWPS